MKILESGKLDNVADLKNLVLVLDKYNYFSFILINQNFQEKDSIYEYQYHGQNCITSDII